MIQDGARARSAVRVARRARAGGHTTFSGVLSRGRRGEHFGDPGMANELPDVDFENYAR